MDDHKIMIQAPVTELKRKKFKAVAGLRGISVRELINELVDAEIAKYPEVHKYICEDQDAK